MTLYKQAIRDDRVREYLPAVRTVMSEGFSKPDFFIGRHAIQSLNTLTDADQINVKKGAYILLDFGMELHGGIRIVTGGGGRGKVRVRFGESVSEAMQTPNQDHSIHDAELELPMMGMMEYGCTGFRFVRIDILADQLNLINVIAVALYRDDEHAGLHLRRHQARPSRVARRPESGNPRHSRRLLRREPDSEEPGRNHYDIRRFEL